MKSLICVSAIEFFIPVSTNVEYPLSLKEMFPVYQIQLCDMRSTLKTYLKNRREAPRTRLCQAQCGVNRPNALSVFM